jgi:hypothetical protein
MQTVWKIVQVVICPMVTRLPGSGDREVTKQELNNPVGAIKLAA